jgi:hypothetical protein
MQYIYINEYKNNYRYNIYNSHPLVAVGGVLYFILKGPGGVEARYVKVYKPTDSTTTMALAELETYDTNGVPSAISQWSAITVPKFMVNGAAHGKYTEDEGVLTETHNVKNPWVMVDLNTVQNIKQVKLYGSAVIR